MQRLRCGRTLLVEAQRGCAQSLSEVRSWVTNLPQYSRSLRSSCAGNISRLTMPGLIGEQGKCYCFFRLAGHARFIRAQHNKPERLHLVGNHPHQRRVPGAAAADDVLGRELSIHLARECARRYRSGFCYSLPNGFSDRYRRQCGCGGQNVRLVCARAAPAQKACNKLAAKLLPSSTLRRLASKERML